MILRDPTWKPKVYLAGPEVFLPDPIAAGRAKKELCERMGFEGLYPLDNEVPETSDMSHVIYRGNVALMHRADICIAHLTPFGGIHADAGTVFEVGFMTALGKPVFAYTNDINDLLKRMQLRGEAFEENGRWVNGDRMMIEDFGNCDNLMLDACLAMHGHPILRVATSVETRYTDLHGFERCLLAARAFLGLDEVRVV